MKLNTLSFLTTTVALVAAVPAPEAGRCTFPCLTIFNKCMYEHQGNISLCRVETVEEIPSCTTCKFLSSGEKPFAPTLKARDLTCDNCMDQYNFCVDESSGWGGNKGIGACEKSCAKHVCLVSQSEFCKTCDPVFADNC